MRYAEDKTMDMLQTQEESSPSPVQGHYNKHGTKPVNSTVAQRKQRNRQAQAAFRERRIEHIKELEAAVAGHRTDLHRAQAAHAKATDECLMLRYKNSLLERILLEKGIDVQVELREKTTVSDLDPVSWMTRRPNNEARASTSSHASSIRPKNRSENPTLRIFNSPTSPANSPPSSATESGLSPRSANTTPPLPGSLFVPMISPQDVQFTNLPAPTTKATLKSTSSLPVGGRNGNQQAAASILKSLQASKRGSMREAAAYYLSSFLEHIEKLEKQSESPIIEKDFDPYRNASGNPRNVGHLDCQMDDRQNPNQDPHVSFENVDELSMTQTLTPYDQIVYSDTLGLEASMQFSAQYKF